MKSLVTRLHPKLAKFPNLYVLSANITDFTRTIANEKFTLIQITPKNKDRFEKLLETIFQGQESLVKMYSEFGKFILAAPHLNDGRIECYLHNKYANSLLQTNTLLLTINLDYFDWSIRKPPSKSVFDITTACITDIVSVFSSRKSPDINDLDVQLILKKLKHPKKGLNLYRGVKKVFQDKDGISTSIYRNNPEIAKIGMLQDHEYNLVKKLQSKNYYKSHSNVSALTDLRHSGKDTNLLDFSENPNVSLFFACQRSDDIETNGELLILNTNKFKSEDEVNYPLSSDFLLRPAKTQISKERVNAQESVFVYCQHGYLTRDKYAGKVKNLLIYKELKEVLLNQCDKDDDYIFPDFYGFIDNSKNFETPTTIYSKALKLIASSDYFGAFLLLNDYRRETKLDAKFTKLFRGKIKVCNSKLNELYRGRWDPSKF